MSEKTIKQLLFEEKRVLEEKDDIKEHPLTNENLQQAMTLNENLQAYGYTLKPNDIIKLAGQGTEEMQNVLDSVKEYTDRVKASPMYPDFPTEVMNMDEAEYRMHQMLHYFSTYGLETLFGKEVSKGWLPSEDGTEKTESDTALLEAKVISVEPETEAETNAVHDILGKKERMTTPESELVHKIVDKDGPEALEGVKIPFKENMESFFKDIMKDSSKDSTEKVKILKPLCQNTGDVLRGLSATLSASKWKLSTSEKRTVCHLIDSYPDADFAENMWLSKSKSEKAKRMMNQISFNDLSRSESKKQILAAARNNQLVSFEGQVKAELETSPNEAARTASERPGWFLRMQTLFYRNGVSPETLTDLLCQHSEKLSAETLISNINAYDKKLASEPDNQEVKDIQKIFVNVLNDHMSKVETPIKNKKVYMDSGDISTKYTRLTGNDKSMDGGYNASGTAYEIPEGTNHVRFFVYWNDDHRVDVDLHAEAITEDGEQFHIGWNSDYKDHGIVMSGDITHSDAAEFIDVDVHDTDVVGVNFYIDAYNKNALSQIDTCYAGLTVVDKDSPDIELYDPKNCLFAVDCRQKTKSMLFGTMDPQTGILIANEESCMYNWSRANEIIPVTEPTMSLETYVQDLCVAQNAKYVDTPEEADIILTVGKASNENEISLTDNNFFMDAKPALSKEERHVQRTEQAENISAPVEEAKNKTEKRFEMDIK